MDAFFSGIRLYAMVALGIGLVIFVHELGHFLAARCCGVRVETFSLGFGPKLIGWKRGTTSYQLSLVPLGGYVKMAGEEATGGKPAPDELGSKSVGQRFLIFSGGVLMNVLFALVVFPLIMLVGVPLSEPMIGATDPGSPAWQAGLQPGTRVLEVNGNEIHQFGHILNEIALGSPERAELLVLDPGASAPRHVTLTPQRNEDHGIYMIGVRPAADPKGHIEVLRDSAAEKAGLESGDRLLEVVGAPAGLDLDDALASASLRGEPVTVRVAREGGQPRSVTVVPEPSPKGDRRLGIEAAVGRVAAVRGLAVGLGLQSNDRLVSVNGRSVLRPYDLLRALQATSPGSAPAFRVEREQKEIDLVGPKFPADVAGAQATAIALSSDVGLGLIDTAAVVCVTPGQAAEKAGLRDGDRIVSVGDASIRVFKDIIDANKRSTPGQTLTLGVERVTDGKPETLTLSVEPAVVHTPTYGFGVREATYVKQVRSPVEAVTVGVTSSWRFIEESWLTLKRILLGHVASKNIGGIITIGVVSHSWAADGWAKLLFFLCMLSMNLAFLNVLPIPVLDGGHLLFLLVEKIKGSPVSERVMGYSQMVGVVLIVSLMVYVMYNDVRRWILPG